MSAMAYALCTSLRAGIFFQCVLGYLYIFQLFLLQSSGVKISISYHTWTQSSDWMNESQTEIMCKAFINSLMGATKEIKFCRELSCRSEGSLLRKVKTCKFQISEIKKIFLYEMGIQEEADLWMEC